MKELDRFMNILMGMFSLVAGLALIILSVLFNHKLK